VLTTSARLQGWAGGRPPDGLLAWLLAAGSAEMLTDLWDLRCCASSSLDV
jgi:hypothetical protein